MCSVIPVQSGGVTLVKGRKYKFIYLDPDWLSCCSDEEGSKLGVRAGIRRSYHGVGGIGPLAPLTMSLSVPTPSGGSHGEKVSPGRRRPSYVPSTLAASTTIEHQEPSGKRQYKENQDLSDNIPSCGIWQVNAGIWFLCKLWFSF